MSEMGQFRGHDTEVEGIIPHHGDDSGTLDWDDVLENMGVAAARCLPVPPL